MNLDNDYDDDGNNIVPCPMCMSNYNPCKNGGRCPAEYSFVIEGQVRLLLDEFEATGDRSRITNVMEAVDRELEKAVEAARKEDAQRVIEWLYDRELPLPLYLVQILGGVTFPTKTDKQTEV